MFPALIYSITPNLVLQGLADGLLLGGVYGLLAMGLSLCYGVTRVSNSAHAAFAILGAMISFSIFTLFGLDPILSIAIPVVALFCLGILTYKILIKKVINLPAMTSFTLTFFLAFLIENSMVLIWHNEYRAIVTSYAGTSFGIGGISLSIPKFVTFLMAILCLVVLSVFIRKTYTGKAMRALSQNRTASYLMGVNVDRLYMLTFAIALASGGAAGAFMSVIYTFYPSIQSIWIAKLYVIVTIGGMGSIMGSLVTALLIGILEATVGVFIPSMWASVIMWLLLLFVLLVRPEGLFGGRKK